MFRSKRRDVFIPQSEHARLSGALARVWGNKLFARPEFDFNAFVTGVVFHDRGYPPLDESEIGSVDELEWLELQKQGAEQEYQDPYVDLVVKFHVRRILGYRPTPERQAYLIELDRIIEQCLKRHNLDRRQFEWADRITNFCDNLSFDFCFEMPQQGSVAVFAQTTDSESIELSYQLDGQGSIGVDPWPFSVEQLEGYIIGYRAAGYPQQLQPLSLCYQLHGF